MFMFRDFLALYQQSAAYAGRTKPKCNTFVLIHAFDCLLEHLHLFSRDVARGQQGGNCHPKFFFAPPPK